MTADTKICPSCTEAKPLSEFHKDRTRRDGLNPRCKECNKATVSAWQKAHLENMRANRRKYKAANRERLYAAQVAWRKANPDKVAASNERRRKKATTPTPPQLATR